MIKELEKVPIINLTDRKRYSVVDRAEIATDVLGKKFRIVNMFYVLGRNTEHLFVLNPQGLIHPLMSYGARYSDERPEEEIDNSKVISLDSLESAKTHDIELISLEDITRYRSLIQEDLFPKSPGVSMY